MTKRKDERRELLKEDELHSFLERVARYVQQNLRQVILGSVVLLILLFAISKYADHSVSRRDEQAQALYGAEKILDTDIADEKAKLKFASEKEKYEQALVILDETISSQSGVVKQQAIISKIAVLVNLGRQTEIEDLYQSIIGSDKHLKMFGLMGLGEFYLAEARFQDARTQFSKLKTLGDFDLGDLAHYKLALCYQAEEDLEKAKSELSQLIDAYEGEEDAVKKPPILVKAQQLYDEITKDEPKEIEKAS